MQNDLKYGKISKICGINGYFAGKNKTKLFICKKFVMNYYYLCIKKNVY